MNRKSSSVNFWYFVIILGVITSVLWFFIDFNANNQDESLSEEAQAMVEPINESFNQKALDNLHQRITLSDIDLADVKPYAKNNVVKNETKEVSTANPWKTASSSGDFDIYYKGY